MHRLWLRVVLFAGVLLFSISCSTLGYYSQSVSGQLGVMAKRQPVDELISDPGTDPQLKQRLVTVQAIRRFASDTLALPDNRSYTLYADIGRPFVVWNVFAAPELSLELKTWCYPFAGCVAYRGYFARADAAAFAKRLREQGYDVYSGGVKAYSTLGWFDDPVLNTVMEYSEARLAGLIFHELAHAQLYVADDTAFNESFATAVELAGVDAWLAQQGDAGAAREYREFHARQAAFHELVARTRGQLVAVYASDIDDEGKRREKQRLIGEMGERYADLKRGWGGEGDFDAWFAADINNAQLAATSAYREYLPAFRQLLHQSDGDYARFYRAAEEIGALPAGERRRRLLALADAGSSGQQAATLQAVLSGLPCVP
jgi:predicted aminopeptidase